MATTESPGKEKCLADSPVVQPMDSFRVLNESEVQKVIEATPKKSCSPDPMPTPLVVGCIDILLPVITKVINLSLQTGSFADQWKCALVHPLLKKLGLDLVFQRFRPVNNLYLVKHASTGSSMKFILICHRLNVNITALKRRYSKLWTTSSWKWIHSMWPWWSCWILEQHSTQLITISCWSDCTDLVISSWLW